MMADNDLALGRVVEAVSKSPQWKETCIFVIEDDAQSGPDHVDGHRTVFMVISPYTKRKFVDSTFYAQTSMIRSIELILGPRPHEPLRRAGRPDHDLLHRRPRPDSLSRRAEQHPARRAEPLRHGHEPRTTGSGSRRPASSTGATSTPPTPTG